MNPVAGRPTITSRRRERVRYSEPFDFDEPNISLHWKNVSCISRMRTLSFEPFWPSPKPIGLVSDRGPRAKGKRSRKVEFP